MTTFSANSATYSARRMRTSAAHDLCRWGCSVREEPDLDDGYTQVTRARHDVEQCPLLSRRAAQGRAAGVEVMTHVPATLEAGNGQNNRPGAHQSREHSGHQPRADTRPHCAPAVYDTGDAGHEQDGEAR